MTTKKCSSENKNSIQLFYYEGLSVRTLNFDGDIWFIAKDVADILGYRDALNATRYLDDDEKALFNSRDNSVLFWHSIQEGEDNTTLNWSSIQEENKPTNCRSIHGGAETQTQKRGNPNIIIISEPGLYELALRSNKPEARAFSRWVRHDVLPQIRKTGQFSFGGECEYDKQYSLQKRAFFKEEFTRVKFRIDFWKKMLKAIQAIDDVMLSNGPIPVTGVPRGLNEDFSDIRMIENMRQFLKENVESKIHSLESNLSNLRNISGMR